MKISLFVCLSLLMSQSFAMSMLQFPILSDKDFIVKKAKNTTTAKQQNATSIAPIITGSVNTVEPKPPEPLISKHQNIEPLSTSLSMQQAHPKTTH